MACMYSYDRVRFVVLRLPLHRLAGFERPDCGLQAEDALAEVVGPAGERRKRAEVHRDHFVRAQQAAGEGSLARAHGEEVADGQEGQFRVVELLDQRHVGEDVGVAREVERAIVGEAQDVPRRLAALSELRSDAQGGALCHSAEACPPMRRGCLEMAKVQTAALLPVLPGLVDVPRSFMYLFPFPFALQGEQGIGEGLVALRLAAQFAVALPPLGGERSLSQRALDGASRLP